MSNEMTTKGLDPELLQFLKQPDSYSHHPDHVEHIQTHISHVFIAHPYVYKLKKAVNFGFLDYSTLENRRALCYREIELNRRLADDTYLAVVGIVKKKGQYALEAADSEDVVEYAVKMRRLEDRFFLHRYIERGELNRQHLDRVADTLADFYQSQEAGDKILKWGQMENIRYNTDENFKQTASFIGNTIDRLSYDTIRQYTNRYFDQHAGLFEKRLAEKRIVDGHGDLHLEHIHITPQKVRIYDCIEFNERFRYGDLAVDLAYLAMDLDFNGCWREERYFIEQMAGKLDDPDLEKIINFYKCYRAYVKGKVKSLQRTEEEVPQNDRDKASELASRYFNLSLRYALLGAEPVVMVFMGRVGTGKSTLSEKLAHKLSIDHFSSDRIRKSMAGLPLTKRPPESDRLKLYSAAMSGKTYHKLRQHAEQAIRQGKSVILDATFNSPGARKQLIDMVDALDGAYLFIEARAPDKVIEKRLKKRDERGGEVSDARLEDFEKLSAGYRSPEEVDRKHLITVETDQSPEDSFKQLYSGLMERNLAVE